MAETKASIARSLSADFRGDLGFPRPLRERKGKKRRSMRPNPKSSPKEIVGSHGHRPHGPSILWPALYEHLRAKGKTKEAAARISNAAWKKKKMGLKTNTPTSVRGVVKNMPGPSDVHVNVPLGNVSVDYVQNRKKKCSCEHPGGKGKRCSKCGRRRG